MERICQTRRHRHLGGEVKYLFGVADGAAQRLPVTNVGDLDAHSLAVLLTEPCHVVLDSGPRHVVVDHYRSPRLEDAVGEIRADESGAAGDQDVLLTAAGAPGTRVIV